MNERIVVIGGGPAGVAAASSAAPFADAVTIVSDRPVDAWHQLQPSGVWSTGVDNLFVAPGPETSAARELLGRSRVTLAEVHAHADRIVRRWSAQQARHLQALGVAFIKGKASFQSPSRLKMAYDSDDDMTVEADAFIMAAGSIPFAPPPLAQPAKCRICHPVLS